MNKVTKRGPIWKQGRKLAAVFAVLSGILLAGADDIYSNDFSTRTSERPLPGDRWLSYDYDPSTTLYYNYPYSGGATTSNLWEKSEEYQDAWVRAWMDDATMQNPSSFALATDSVHGSSDNYFAHFRSSSSRSGCAIQPLHNEFTNGMLRLEVDIRRPAAWGPENDSHVVRVALVYRKWMANPIWGVGLMSTENPLMFGARLQNGSSKNRLVLHYRNSSNQQTYLEPGASGDDYVCSKNWYRWRVYVNLDEQRSNYYIWDAGPDQPTGRNMLADDTADRKVTSAGYFFSSPMTAETGGISGIALNAYRFLTGVGENLAVTNAPCYDNIHIAWKAPGSSEYVPFYENDFSTRRYRRIQPTPAATVAYPVGSGIPTEDDFTSYVVATNREEASPTFLVNSATGLLGMDNWIRLNTGGKFCVIDSKTNGKNELRVSNGGYGVIAQTLGETIASGKVRISGDVRLPVEWHYDPSNWRGARVCLALCSPDYWSLSDPDAYIGRTVGYGAIVGESKNEFCPAYLPQSGTLVSTKDASVPCTAKWWYRMVVTADLDTKTYDYELYEIGVPAGPIDRTDVPSTPIYVMNGIPFRNDISSIGAFGLYTIQPGSAWDNYVLWDNLQVWKNWNSSAGTGTLIYANDFNKRTRYVMREKTELVHGVNTGVGVDSWEQMNRRDGTAWIAGDANRFLSLKAPDLSSLCMTQPLPREVPNGARVSLRVDVRPPCWWVQDGGGLNVYLGGDSLGQYSYPKGNPLRDSVMMFGLNGADASLGRYTNSLFRVQNGNSFPTIRYGAMKTDHWYRLEGTTRSGSDSWNFRAYDMGTMHPEIDAPAGPLVAASDGLARRGSGATSGISAIAITAGGVSSLDPWELYDRGRVLLDNLVVTVVPHGTIIILR